MKSYKIDCKCDVLSYINKYENKCINHKLLLKLYSTKTNIDRVDISKWEKFKKLNKSNKIFACIGPCIGEKSYEVDLKFYKTFLLKSKKNSVYFKEVNKNKKKFDLRRYINDKLLKLNVKVSHINHDTFRDKDNFFSYRRSQKLKETDYGRCISVISLTA